MESLTFKKETKTKKKTYTTLQTELNILKQVFGHMKKHLESEIKYRNRQITGRKDI